MSCKGTKRERKKSRNCGPIPCVPRTDLSAKFSLKTAKRTPDFLQMPKRVEMKDFSILVIFVTWVEIFAK